MLAAMGVGPQQADTYLRVSIDPTENSMADMDCAAAAIAEVAALLRERGCA